MKNLHSQKRTTQKPCGNLFWIHQIQGFFLKLIKITSIAAAAKPAHQQQ